MKCHNKQTLTEKNYVDIDYIKNRILKTTYLNSAVTFSGGEPTLQIKPLLELCKFSKEHNLFVGIETNGFHTNNLLRLSPYVDRFFIDIKAPLNDEKGYYRFTNNKNALRNIKKSLDLDIPKEIRIVDFQKERTEAIRKSIGNKFKISILPENKSVK